VVVVEQVAMLMSAGYIAMHPIDLVADSFVVALARIVASSAVGRCLVDIVTYTEIHSMFKITHHSEDICKIV
jgi:hypothetical protein